MKEFYTLFKKTMHDKYNTYAFLTAGTEYHKKPDNYYTNNGVLPTPRPTDVVEWTYICCCLCMRRHQDNHIKEIRTRSDGKPQCCNVCNPKGLPNRDRIINQEIVR